MGLLRVLYPVSVCCQHISFHILYPSGNETADCRHHCPSQDLQTIHTQDPLHSNKPRSKPNPPILFTPSSYLALTPLLDEAGFLADLDGSLIPTPPLLINLLRFRYSSTSLSTLPLSCFGFLINTHTALISTQFHKNYPNQKAQQMVKTRHTAYNTASPSSPSSPPSSPPRPPPHSDCKP